jgi:hypothetical protein
MVALLIIWYIVPTAKWAFNLTSLRRLAKAVVAFRNYCLISDIDISVLVNTIQPHPLFEEVFC